LAAADRGRRGGAAAGAAQPGAQCDAGARRALGAGHARAARWRRRHGGAAGARRRAGRAGGAGGAHLRAVLLHQAGGAGHRPGAGGEPHAHRAARRLALARAHRHRRDLHHPAAGAEGGVKLLAFTLSLALGCSSPAPAPAPPPVAAPPPPAPAPPRAITVLKTSADAARVAADGKSHPLAVGDRLGPDESVRTGKGTASLDVVGAAEVEISPGTEVAVGEITATLSKVKLTDGRISAVVHPSDGRGFEVDVPSLGAQATAGAAAQFSMMARGGQVALATRAGSIKLAARGQSVQIGAGQISVVQ